jgi:hypothetical protein
MGSKGKLKNNVLKNTTPQKGKENYSSNFSAQSLTNLNRI